MNKRNTKLINLSIIDREKLFKQLRISITYNSNALEGVTLSYGETKKFIRK